MCIFRVRILENVEMGLHINVKYLWIAARKTLVVCRGGPT